MNVDRQPQPEHLDLRKRRPAIARARPLRILSAAATVLIVPGMAASGALANSTTAAAHTQPTVRTVSGVVLSPRGAPISDDAVMIYASTPPRDSTSRNAWTDPLLGTATTDSAGRWSFTIPEYPELPHAAQQAAQTNNGYVTVTAQAHATARYRGQTYPVSASGVASAWVGTATAARPTTGAMAPRAVTMTVRPQGRAVSGAEVAAAVSGGYAAAHAPRLTATGVMVGNAHYIRDGVPTNRFGYQITSDNDYNPNVTTTGVDITRAVYRAVGPADAVNPCNYVSSVIVGHSWAYTVLGEHHAGSDSSGSFTYTVGASTELGTYASADGENFSFSGYEKFTAGGSTSNYINPPGRDGHQTVESLQYIKVRQKFHCLRTGDYYQYRIQENGVFNPGNDWVVFRDGIDVSSWDSRSQFRRYLAHHRKYVNMIKPNAGFTLTKNRAYTYGAAATVLGIGIRAESTHSTAVSQGYRAGPAKIAHHVWGSNAAYADNPQIAYAYSGS